MTRRRSPSSGGSALREQRRGGVEASPPERSRNRPASSPLADPLPSGVSGDLVLLGEFGRAQGLKGEVRLKSFTADPAAIASYGPLLTEHGRTVVLKAIRAAPGAAPDLLVAQVEGVTSREGAEALNRVRLYLERGKLPLPEDDEFLLADLIGLSVRNAAGDNLGTVVAVPNYGGGDLLEIKPGLGGATAFLPFSRAFVPEVDIQARRIVVNAPEDLFDAAKPAPGNAPPEDAA